jgi:hypothetical protein
MVLARPDGARSSQMFLLAPVAADGTFVLGGAPVGALHAGAYLRTGLDDDARIGFQLLPAGSGPLAGVVLRPAKSDRALDVVVRSAVTAPLDAALVIIADGQHAITRIGDLVQLGVDVLQSLPASPGAFHDAPPAIRAHMQPGDLLAHLQHVAPGVITVCAASLGVDLADPKARREMFAHFAQFAVKCKPAAADTAVVELEVPPQERFH